MIAKLMVIAILAASAGCGPEAPEKCSDFTVFNRSCGNDTYCGDYFCMDSKGKACLDGACTKMCTKSCGGSNDCPGENDGILLESQCQSGICVVTKCEVQ